MYDHAARRRVARVGVPPRARDNVDPVPARPANGLLDVRGGLAVDDRVRMDAVVARVDEQAASGVAVLTRRDHGAVDLPLQLSELPLRRPGRERPVRDGARDARRDGNLRGPLDEVATVERLHAQTLRPRVT